MKLKKKLSQNAIYKYLIANDISKMKSSNFIKNKYWWIALIIWNYEMLFNIFIWIIYALTSMFLCDNKSWIISIFFIETA